MSDASAPVQPGEVLDGKYEVERVLGHGGMGVVVAARHLVLRERVALKFLLPAAASRPEIAARFHREAQAAARIRSEHVARVTDVGRMPNGAPYMVMEYLEGRDFGDILQKQGVLDVDRAVDVVLQACVALAEAHKAGIVHRDLKPSNLFLTTRGDGEPCVKVLDFGISKVMEESGQEKLTNGHLGTPAYMPPEQLRSASNVDHRADVWALGAILFELTAGTYAFASSSLAELFASILSSPPIPLRHFRPDAPPELEAALLRCFEKDREHRWQDVGAFAAAIAPFGGPTAGAMVARIARTLGQQLNPSGVWSVRSSMASIPHGGQLTPGGAGGATPPGAGRVHTGPPTPSGHPGAISAGGSAGHGAIPRGTAVGTSYTLGGSTKRSPAMFVAVGLAVFLGVAVVVAGLFVLRGDRVAPAASGQAVAPPPTAAPATPSAEPTSSAVAADPAPVETAAPSAAASAAPLAERPRGGRPAPQPPRTAGARPTAGPAAPATTPTSTDYGGRK